MPVPIINGGTHRNNNEEYINELRNLKGRIWLLFSHVHRNEEAYVVRNLDSLGYKKIKAFKTDGSSTYLYFSE